MNDNVASATNIGHGIYDEVLEKHRIKRADSFMISKILPLNQEMTQKDAKRLACTPSSLILAAPISKALGARLRCNNDLPHSSTG